MSRLVSYLLGFLVLLLALWVCVGVWQHFHPGPEVDPRYEQTQQLLLQTRRDLDTTAVALHTTRDSVRTLEEDKTVALSRAAAAEDAANRLHAKLPTAPAPSDSTNPVWMHRAQQLGAENVELRAALMDKGVALRNDSAEIHLYQLQLRRDSLVQSETRGAITESQSTLTTEHAAATGKARLWGILPLPSRTQSFLAGAVTFFIASEAVKHARP